MSRLTEQEIDRAVARIRSEYDHYIVHFHKTPETKRAFEERYTDVLRHRTDLTLFLGEEIRVVKTLIEKARIEDSKPPRPKPRPGKRPSYTERILEENRARIQAYPDLGLPDHSEKSPDVDKLFGTLRWFRQELWEHVYPILSGRCDGATLFAVDSDLGDLVPQGDRWPKAVETYWVLLTGRAELTQVARAQNRCLLLGAQVLQRIKRLLDAVQTDETLTGSETRVVGKAQALIDKVLTDFRLKDLASHT